MKNKITIICGHYGCGKTNLSLNLALNSAKLEPTVLVDMDVVNPYFRSSEHGAMLSDNDIELIAPVTANSTVDSPVLPPELFSVFSSGDVAKTFYIDVGGDDAGITALATISTQLNEYGYEMYYVINKYRVLSQTSDEAVRLLHEIEAASRLKATGVINNSHLRLDTTVETVEASLGFAKETAEKLNLPLLYSTIPDFAVKAEGENKDFVVVKHLVKFPWEE